MEKGAAVLSLNTKEFKYSYLILEDVYKDKPMFVGIIPSFNLTAHASTPEELAEHLDTITKSFFNFYFKHKEGTIFEHELKRCKWEKSETEGEFTFEYKEIPEYIEIEKFTEAERTYNFTEQYIQR